MKQNILLFMFILVVNCATAQTSFNHPVKPEVVLVQGGTFTMGSNEYDWEKPTHSVTVSTFSIGKYEVTVGQYNAFCSATGRQLSGDLTLRYPITYVSYDDCVAYCNWLGETYGGNWRLPTEAEWEYAARGGNKSTGYIYSGGNDMDQLGWYADNSNDQTQEVGLKKPNELGLYDMSGNVGEWCKDWYSDSYYAESPASNPKGPATGAYRVLRGGNWEYSASGCRVAHRYSLVPIRKLHNYGFRVVLSQ